jgi:4-amino-4-deoxy-L-arabinose transferase-like glycosyltransferase
MSNKSSLFWIILISTGVILRVIFLLYFGPIELGDTISYTSLSQKILAGHFYEQAYDIFRPPGYPLFLSLLLLPDGENYYLIIIFQQILSMFTAVLVFYSANIIFGEHVAKFSAWLTMIHPVLIYFASIILPESLVIFLVTLAVTLIIKGIKHKPYLNFSLAGISFAFTLLLKPTGLLVSLVFAGVINFIPEIKQRLLRIILILLPVIIIFLSWSYHNQIKFGGFAYDPINGLNLLERTVYLHAPNLESPIVAKVKEIYLLLKEDPSYTNQASDWFYWRAVTDTYRSLRGTTDIFELNNAFFSTAIHLIKSDPIGYARSTIGELFYIWAGYTTTGGGKTRPIHSGDQADWSYIVLGPLLGFFMVILVLNAIYDNLREKNINSLIVWAPTIIIPLTFAMVSFTGFRYRLVVEPLLLILISYSLIRLKSHTWWGKVFG